MKKGQTIRTITSRVKLNTLISLIEEDACPEALLWVKEEKKHPEFDNKEVTPLDLWERCHNPMWMTWLLVEMRHPMCEAENIMGRVDRYGGDGPIAPEEVEPIDVAHCELLRLFIPNPFADGRKKDKKNK